MSDDEDDFDKERGKFKVHTRPGQTHVAAGGVGAGRNAPIVSSGEGGLDEDDSKWIEWKNDLPIGPGSGHRMLAQRAQAAVEKQVALQNDPDFGMHGKQDQPQAGARQMSYSAEERDLGIRTIIGEAGNQSDTGQQAVAHNIRNRWIAGYGGRSSLGGIIKAPLQYSTWNDTENGAYQNATKAQPGSPEYERAAKNFDTAFGGGADPTNNASNYSVPSQSTDHSQDKMVGANTTWIGAHRFVGQLPAHGPVQTALGEGGGAVQVSQNGTGVTNPSGTPDWAAPTRDPRAQGIDVPKATWLRANAPPQDANNNEPSLWAPGHSPAGNIASAGE